MKLQFITAALLAAAFTMPVGATAAVKPHATPVPGGANQLQAVAGPLSATLFNGQVRARKMSLGKPDQSPGESYTDDATNVWLAFHALMSNGTHRALNIEQFAATIVDADGVAVAAAPDRLRPMGSINGIPPGGAWREGVVFAVPHGFKPVKIVLQPTDAQFKAFRISLTSSDVPAAAP